MHVPIKKLPIKPPSPNLRTLTHFLDLVLLPLLLISFISGWIASLSGLTEFGLHKWSSVALIILAGGHLYLHWRMFQVHGKALGAKGLNALDDANENQERMFPKHGPINWRRVVFVLVVVTMTLVVLSRPLT